MPVPATLAFGLAGPASAAGQVNITFHGFEQVGRLELNGAGTYAIDLGMMPSAGLKGLLVMFDAVDAAGAAVSTPIALTWTSNSVSKSEELSPGGMFQIGSPAPVYGITALSIVYTANAVVHVYALG